VCSSDLSTAPQLPIAAPIVVRVSASAADRPEGAPVSISEANPPVRTVPSNTVSTNAEYAPTRPRIDAMIRDVIADLLFARNDPTELAVEPQAQRSVKSFPRRFVHQRDRSPHQPTLPQLGHV